MCGILFSSCQAIDPAAFESALALMRFRGPDSGNIVRLQGCQLGHRRLKIQDLSDEANQPFVSASGRYSIVFNGEIYNFKELRKKYAINTRTQCDVEVLLELYERFQERCLDELNGMFAFVIVDKQTESVFAARDRLGIKPLYWHQGHEGVLFSSEIKPIRRLIGADRVSEEGLRQYLKLRTFFNNRTLFEDIQSFPAGHYYLDGKIQQYWQLPENAGMQIDDEALKELLTSAVNYRMIADVPVGTFLSGGLDSTIVTYLAGDVLTWTAGSEFSNEFEWSRLAAEYLELECREVEVAPDEFVNAWDEMLGRRGEPLSVPNEVLLYLMSYKLKNEITVVLSGEGADELFFGYDRIFKWAADSPWDLKAFDKYYSYSSHQDLEIVDSVIEPFKNRPTTLETVSAFFQIAHLHGLLRRLDFATMLASVEARVPFVDHRLIEYVSRTDPALRHTPEEPKRVLKNLFIDHLPSEITQRKKVGFPVDLAGMMGKEADYSDFLNDNLSKLNIAR